MRGHWFLSKLPETHKANKDSSSAPQSDLTVQIPDYYNLWQNPQWYCQKTHVAGPEEYLKRERGCIQEKDVSLKKTRKEATCYEG